MLYRVELVGSSLQDRQILLLLLLLLQCMPALSRLFDSL
jgi:hypothetical protein